MKRNIGTKHWNETLERNKGGAAVKCQLYTTYSFLGHGLGSSSSPTGSTTSRPLTIMEADRADAYLSFSLQQHTSKQSHLLSALGCEVKL